MKKLLFLLFVISCQSGKVYWSYKDPEAWGKVSGICSKGNAQSPLELFPAEKSKLPILSLNYEKTAFVKTEEHGSIKFTPKEKIWIEVDGKRYEFLQVHFHTPSEHQVRGKSYPLEGHFVHSASDGELMVVGVLFQLGKTNKNIDQLFQSKKLNPIKLIPKKKTYYRYDGSLTTPPCSEGVKWIVMKKPISLSPEQLKNFYLEGNTNRPIRPLNDRKILQSE